MKIVRLTEKVLATHKPLRRIATGIASLDRVLGGGFVRGSVTIVSGQPGVGATTLLMQAAASAAKRHRALFMSGEESVVNLIASAKRLGLICAKRLKFRHGGDVDEIESNQFDLIVVDSLQTASVNCGTPGSASQKTAAVRHLSNLACDGGAAVVVIAHRTKRDKLPCSKSTLHTVGAAVRLERYRLLPSGVAPGFVALTCAEKQRFGRSDAMATLRMTPKGFEVIA